MPINFQPKPSSGNCGAWIVLPKKSILGFKPQAKNNFFTSYLPYQLGEPKSMLYRRGLKQWFLFLKVTTWATELQYI